MNDMESVYDANSLLDAFNKSKKEKRGKSQYSGMK